MVGGIFGGSFESSWSSCLFLLLSPDDEVSSPLQLVVAHGGHNPRVAVEDSVEALAEPILLELEQGLEFHTQEQA